MDYFERKVVSELKKQNYQNFEKFYYKYVDYIHYVISLYIKDSETIDDLTQEVFMRIIDKINLFDDSKSSFKTWIFNVTKNYTINHITQNKEKYILDEEAINKTNKSTDLNYEMLKLDLKTYLTDLEYQVLFLRIEAKLKHSEISEVLNITIDKSKKTYQVAISKAKEILK